MQEGLIPNENQVKIELELKKLSKEQHEELGKMLAGQVEEMKNSDILKDGISFEFELTHIFESEPKYHAYLKGAFICITAPFPLMTPQGMKQVNNLMIDLRDMELYKPDNIDYWLDHVDRIDKLKGSSIAHKKGDTKFMVNKGNHNEKEKDVSEAENQIEEMLSGIFDESEKQYTVEQYRNIFMVNASKVFNATFIGLLEGYESSEHTALSSVAALQELHIKFSKCDFTKFNSQQLKFFGFVNWSDKMMLIPVWALPVVMMNNKGIKLTSIDKKEVVVGRDVLEFRVRYGCTIYGLQMEQLADYQPK